MIRHFIFLLLLFPFSGLAQNFTLKGVVKDSASNEGLPGASVYTVGQKYGTMTDPDGNYELSLPVGTHEIEVYFYGYKTFNQTVKISGNQTLDFPIASATEQLEVIVLKGERSNDNVQDTKVSTIEISVEEIKKLPALMGEVDIIKNIQMLPGVQVAGEGNSGLYVRGGGADQNLVTLDHATVYNPVHALGIFSVFNADAIKSAEIYKGGIPPQYGGRLSSILDVRSNTGNKDSLRLSGGIGLLSARLKAEGPIVKDKLSYFISGRRTYFDVFLKLSNDKEARQSKLYFYDLNGKISWKINAKNNLDLTLYGGRDVFGFADFFRNDYGNSTGTLNFSHTFNERFTSESILTYSNFDFNISLNMEAQGMKIKNGVSEFKFKQLFNYELSPKNQLSFGVEASHKKYLMGELLPNGEESIFQETKVPNQNSLDEAIFISNKQKISSRITADYGLRFSIFSLIGPGETYKYNGAITESNISDTISHSSFDFVKTYTGLEPRAAVRYLLNENSSIKASYNRMYQYLHLMSNSTSPIPGNNWVPSSEYLKPERSDQIATGYFRNFKENTFEASVEVYYKHMKDVVDFVDDAELFLNKHIETEIRSGKSNAYGAEFFLRKHKGKTTGWISYTWSKVTRQIDGINNGQEYPASYDRRNNLNLVVTHELTKKISVAATFVYGTGRPFTLPSAKYSFGQSTPVYYTSRNAYKLKDYHRMDVAVNINLNDRGKFKSHLNISVYNLYGRKNPFTVMVSDVNEDGTGGKKLEMIYLFRWLPSITYNFEF